MTLKNDDSFDLDYENGAGRTYHCGWCKVVVIDYAGSQVSPPRKHTCMKDYLNEPGYMLSVERPEGFKMVTEIEEKKVDAAVVHPKHYNKGIEVWDFTTSHDMNFLQGNVVKYVTRYKYKSGLQDLKKAQQYLSKLIESEEAKG